MTEKLNHARVPRRFYILTLLIFVLIFYCLLAIRAHWYGWAIAVVAFAGLVAIRRSRFWRGWHAPLCFTLAFLAAYAGLSLSRPRWDVSLPGQIGGGTVWLFTHLPAEEEVTAGMMGLSVWRPPEGVRRAGGHPPQPILARVACAAVLHAGFSGGVCGTVPQPAPMGRIPAGADWRGHGVAVHPSARGRGSDGRHDGTVGMAAAGRIPYGNRAAPGKHHGGADA